MENEIWHILLVEDDEDDYFIVRKMLSEAHPEQFILKWVTTNTDGMQALQAQLWDAILVDYDLGGETGDQFIRDAMATGCQCPILVLTGRGNYEIDMKTMQAGAADYLNKAELNPDFLERSIRYAIGRKQSEENLKITQARFDIALKNSEITVYTTDRELRYTWLYRPMLPYLSVEVIGKRDDELPEAPHLMELIQLKQQVLDSRAAIHKEIQLCFDDDDIFYLDLTIEPYDGPAGEVIGTIVSCVNTTRFHQMEEQIQTSIAHVALQRKIMESREEERKQISRDLHDGPIQNTIGLLFAIESALGLSNDEEQLTLLKNIQREAQKLVGELREVCNQLRPPVLAQFGLGKAIRSYLADFQEKHSELALQLDLCNDRQAVPEAARLALYRVLQEGLSNIVRHSHATEITVSYKLADQHAVLTIQDNGDGMKTPIDWRKLASQGHLGLVGMKERVEALNGSLNITSNNGKGTQIQAAIPYL